jgi:hypothetical protein
MVNRFFLELYRQKPSAQVPAGPFGWSEFAMLLVRAVALENGNDPNEAGRFF